MTTAVAPSLRRAPPPTDQATGALVQPQTIPAVPRVRATGSPRVAGPVPGSLEPGLLDLLRGDVGRRPVVDPYLAGGLRDWLEDGLAAACADLTPDRPVFASTRAITEALLGDEHADHDSDRADEPGVTVPMARGALVSAAFRQLVTDGPASDPVRDALDALSVDRGCDRVVAFIGALPADERARLFVDAAEHMARLCAGWSRLPASWFARTKDRIRFPLAGGMIVLAATPDLVIGAPCQHHASVCLVDVIAGTPRPQHRDELHFTALLETLRSGAPPCRVVAWYSTIGDTQAENISEVMLATAVQRTIDGVGALVAGRIRA